MSDLSPVMLNVTEKDIKRAHRQGCQYCPFELAARRHLKCFSGVVMLNCDAVYDDADVSRPMVPLSKKVSRWIASFDANRAVRPIRARVYIPKDLLREKRQ